MTGSPSIRRIAVAVRQISAATAVYETLFGLRFAPSPAVAADAVTAVEAPTPGGPILEIVQPVDDEGLIARFIRKRGEGIHHLSLRVPDLQAAVRDAAAQGGRILRGPSYYRRPDGSRLNEAFVHPKDAHGVLLHLTDEA